MNVVYRLSSLVGEVTLLVEESGVHSWAIYPTTYEDGEPTICVSMTKATKRSDEFPVVKSQFTFELDTSMYDIQVRLDCAVLGMNDLAEKEGFEFADSPRRENRKTWESVL